MFTRRAMNLEGAASAKRKCPDVTRFAIAPSFVGFRLLQK